jgi:hypothetical protein
MSKVPKIMVSLLSVYLEKSIEFHIAIRLRRR